MQITSDFQRYYSCGLIEVFKDIPFIPELRIGKGRIDLGTKDGKYGIEIKSSVGDLKSGCGLNQENFEYGYVACPENVICQAIGYLYLCDMKHSGVLMLKGNGIKMIKPAIWNADNCKDKPLPIIKTWLDCDNISLILDGREPIEL